MNSSSIQARVGGSCRQRGQRTGAGPAGACGGLFRAAALAGCVVVATAFPGRLPAADGAQDPAPAASAATRAQAAAWPKGGLVELLPVGADLGAGWDRVLHLLTDPTSSPPEYFPEAIQPDFKGTLKKRLRGNAHCQVGYTHGGSLVFEAWLTRYARAEDAAAEWDAIQSRAGSAAPGNARPNPRRTKVGGRDALVVEGETSSTLWVPSTGHTLSITLFRPGGIPEEFLKTVAAFAKRLPGAPGEDATRGGGGPAAGVGGAGGRRVVRAIGDLYVALERDEPTTVHLAPPRHHPGDGTYRFGITNAGAGPILVWNVRVQVRREGAAADAEDAWQTVRSDYPSSVAALPPGATGEERVTPPGDSVWRVCLLYTRQPAAEGSGRLAGAGAGAGGEFELVSQPVLGARRDL